MIRTLLATTAVAAVLALPVIAQDASSSMESSSMADSSMSSMESSAMDSSMMSSSAMDSSAMSTESSAMADTSSAEVVTDASSSMMSSEMMSSEMMSSEMPADTSSMMSSEPMGGFDIVTGYTQIDSDRFATRIIGQGVYDSAAEDANHLGDINDIVIDESGRAIAVTIGVGGFLGIGEKQVAVSYSALEWTVAADNSERFVLQTTVEELTAAPDFVVVEDNPADGGSSAPAVTSEAVSSEGGDAMATSSAAM